MRGRWLLAAAFSLTTLCVAHAQDENKTESWNNRKEVFAEYKVLNQAAKDGHGTCVACYVKLDAFLEKLGATEYAVKNARLWAKAAQATGDHAQYLVARHTLAAELALQNQSDMEIHRKQMVEAEAAIAEVLQADPENADTRFLYAQTLSMQRRYSEASAEFRKVAESGGSAQIKRLAQRFTEEPELGAHRVMPPIRVTLADGRNLDIAQWRGKVVLLDVWASFCSICRVNAPKLKEMLAPYNGHRYAILSVSVDNDLRAWRKAMAKDGMTWAQAIDSGGTISAALGIRPIPRYIVIDDEGVVLYEARFIEDLAGPLAKAISAADARYTGTKQGQAGN